MNPKWSGFLPPISHIILCGNVRSSPCTLSATGDPWTDPWYIRRQSSGAVGHGSFCTHSNGCHCSARTCIIIPKPSHRIGATVQCCVLYACVSSMPDLSHVLCVFCMRCVLCLLQKCVYFKIRKRAISASPWSSEFCLFSRGLLIVFLHRQIHRGRLRLCSVIRRSRPFWELTFVGGVVSS